MPCLLAAGGAYSLDLDAFMIASMAGKNLLMARDEYLKTCVLNKPEGVKAIAYYAELSRLAIREPARISATTSPPRPTPWRSCS